MAAMVERPLSAMSTTDMDPVVAQQRRRRESVEIIDVDLLDDDVASRHASVQPFPTPPPPPPPVPRPRIRQTMTAAVMEPEMIFVLDSEEDEEEEVIRGTSNGRQARSRLISPPPPHAHRPSPVPPVPPVPSRYAGHTSLPMRPPVRAIARPFDFEADHHPRYPIPATANHRRRIGSPPLHASAQSHHVPSMGLGGALISSYRDSQHQNAHHHHHNHRHSQPGLLARAGAAASGFANRLSRNLAHYRNWGSGDNGPAGHFGGGSHRHHRHHDHHHNHHHLPPDTRDDDALARLLVETEMQELFGRHLLRHFVRDQQPQSMTYQPAYTHPRPADPGFTHDFGAEPTPTSTHRRRHSGPIVIDDDEMEVGSSSAARRASSPVSIKSTNVLVCARCLEPLVLSAGLLGEDAERRRVWGLRCGHLIDGKCLKEIGQPSGDASDEEGTTKTEVKSRGKARRASPAKGKGKGKAKAVDEEPEAETETPERSVGTGAAIASSPPDNSIRSRLRSSRTSSTLSITASPTSPASTRRKRTRKPKIEGEYRYLCPVVGCGSIHVSVKADGEWRSERDEDRKKPGGRRSIKFPHDLVADEEGGVDVRGRGAIPVFV
ncbi:hypothetical protein M378DRAFT_10587 [Amanita muscaria Koide BX008]|uniref:Uncharacterized protein n=1 Tax=Amanita muscaria (strain Koide BX008) TaxID=946122 RepID=A0A0C2WVB1_AMAMK|nr:hypothetical protein M378DRAFT_10587 [Amanita muscaria Koide BX008]